MPILPSLARRRIERLERRARFIARRIEEGKASSNERAEHPVLLWAVEELKAIYPMPGAQQTGSTK